jgi:hypothetical protein
VIDGPILSSGPFHNDLLVQLLSTVADSANTSGTPWYVDDHDEGDVIHVKIFGLAEYLGMDALCDLALARIFKNLEVTFHAQSRRDALNLLMPINQNREKTDYMVIAKALRQDWDRFGIIGPAKDVLDNHKVLQHYFWGAAFHDDAYSSGEWCFDALKKSLG